MKVIAHIHSDFPTKFGIPRQSGLVESLKAKIVFEPEYRNSDALRGMEEYSHLWLIWEFSEAKRDTWSPTVRPPRLGGNKRMGVFATRSPYRPNPIGLSCVKLETIDYNAENGPVIIVSGADLLDGTPIYDIKPYLPFADSRPEAVGGFADTVKGDQLQVICEPNFLDQIPEEHRQAVLDILAQDPRPHYQQDPNRIYGMEFANMEIKFKVEETTLIVCQIIRKDEMR